MEQLRSVVFDQEKKTCLLELVLDAPFTVIVHGFNNLKLSLLKHSEYLG